jgi:hypothetical protein
MGLRLRSLIAHGRSKLGGIPLSLVAFELLLVFLAVAAALLANGWWQARSDSRAARAALDGVRIEIAANRQQIERRIGQHRAIVAAAELLLAELSAGAPPPPSIHALRERLTGDRGLSPPLLSRAAWEGSLASGQLRSVPFDELKGVASVYELQQRAENLVDSLLGQFVAPDTYRSDRLPEIATSLLVTYQMLVEMESELLQAYGQTSLVAPPTP